MIGVVSLDAFSTVAGGCDRCCGVLALLRLREAATDFLKWGVECNGMRAAGRGGWLALGDVISLSFEAGMTAAGDSGADVPPIEADIDDEEASNAHEAEDEAEDKGD